MKLSQLQGYNTPTFKTNCSSTYYNNSTYHIVVISVAKIQNVLSRQMWLIEIDHLTLTANDVDSHTCRTTYSWTSHTLTNPNHNRGHRFVP